MSDPNAVRLAVVQKLTDPTLQSLMPDGVHYEVARNATRFVLILPIAHDDTAMFGGSAYERYFLRIEAVEKANTNTQTVLAARRINALLMSGKLDITGYTHMATLRPQNVNINEVDDHDVDVRWQRVGGYYELFVSPD